MRTRTNLTAIAAAALVAFGAAACEGEAVEGEAELEEGIVEGEGGEVED